MMLVADFRRVHGMEATLNTLRGAIGEVKGQFIQPREREREREREGRSNQPERHFADIVRQIEFLKNILVDNIRLCATVCDMANLVRGRSSILPQSMSLTVAWTGGER